MSTFKYFYFFANSSNSSSDESKRQRSRGRVCRVEELEGREMLSVTPWLSVESCDNTFPCENAPVYESSLMLASSEPMQASSAPWNAQARDLEVYNDLVARGSGLEFNWNNDGFITYIYAYASGLEGALDVSGLTALEGLRIYGNQLMELNVSGCTALRSLHDLENPLDVLNISGTAITDLHIYHTSTTFKVYGGTNLAYLKIHSYALQSLDVSNCTALTRLDVWYSQLTSLDLSNNTALDYLSVEYNQLTSLDVSNNTALTVLSVINNQLTTLDVSNNTALTALYATSNQLTSLDVSNNKALIVLLANSNQLTSLYVSNNTALIELQVRNNQLTTLDVSNQTALTWLLVEDNPLEVLNISGTAITEFLIRDSQLTSLDVSNNTALTFLFVFFNTQLTSLDVSNNTALTWLIVQHTQLTSLDVSSNTALERLNVINTQLTSLYVSNNTALTQLFVEHNQLTFSSLLLPENDRTYSIGNQQPVAITLTAGNTIDLSSEYLIDGEHITQYIWFYSNGDVVDSSLYTEANGIFTFTGIQDGSIIYCSMTNDRFPGWTLETTKVMISETSNPLMPPETPTGLANISRTANSIALSWNVVANVTGYEIQYRTGNEAWRIESVTETSATIAFLDSNTTYEFQVRAVNPVNESNWSESIFVTTDRIVALPATPSNLHASERAADSITVEWDIVSNATGYELQYRTGNANWTSISTVETLVVIFNLVEYTTYEFQVRAVNDDGMSEWSSIIPVTTEPNTWLEPLTPSNFHSTGRTIDSITLAWDATDYAMSYEIQYRFGNANWSIIPSIETVVLTIYNLFANTTYEFQVRAVNNEGMSEWSSIISIMTDTAELGTPTLMSAVATGHDTITVTWEPASNASAYRVEYSRSPIFAGTSESVMIYTIDGTLATTTNLTGLLANTTYYIRTIALSGNNISERSNILHTNTDAKQLTTPIISSISVSGTTSLKVEWSTVQHADGYMITYFTGEGNAPQTIFFSSNATSAVIAGLQTGQEYTISITAIGTGEYINSANSDVMLGTPTVQHNVPVAVNPSGVKMMNAKSAYPPTLNSVSLEWRANAANVAYFITQNGTPIPAERITYITNAQSQIVGATITGLESGTRYNFTVAAYNANNEKAQRDITVRATTLAENRAIVKPRAISSVRGIDGTGPTINTVQISWNILTSEVNAYQITIKGSAPNPANSSRMLVQDLATMTISNDGIITNIVMRDIIVNGINVNPLLEEGLLQSRFVDTKNRQGAVTGTALEVHGLNPGARYTFETRMLNENGYVIQHNNRDIVSRVNASTLRYTAVKMRAQVVGQNINLTITPPTANRIPAGATYNHYIVEVYEGTGRNMSTESIRTIEIIDTTGQVVTESMSDLAVGRYTILVKAITVDSLTGQITESLTARATTNVK